MRELESLIVRIVEPPGNKQLGKFAGAEDVSRRFGHAIGEKQRHERNRILNVEEEEEGISSLEQLEFVAPSRAKRSRQRCVEI